MQSAVQPQRVTVTCLETGQRRGADVIRRSDKELRVALEGSVIALTFHREGRPGRQGGRVWICRIAGLEFEAR